MKNTIYLLFTLLFTLFGFSKDIITISGKITNTADGKVKIKGEDFEKEITLKSDGTFKEQITIDYSGNYFLGTKANRTSLYLAKGMKLGIEADDTKFTETLKFSGNGSVENQYFIDKSKIATKFIGNPTEYYSLEESSYLSRVTEIKTAFTNLLNTSKSNDSKFKANEVKNIAFFEQLQFLLYPQYHAHYAKKEGFKPSESFPKLDSSIDLDNEADFLYSPSYQRLVTTKFNYDIAAQLKENEEYTYKFAVPAIKKIKSTAIKNSLIQNVAYEVGAGNPEAELLYNELMLLSNNVKFKDDLTTKFNKIKTLIAGKASPTFDYENFKGGKTSLESLKGKYVYIDVWATWCGPCRKEIPSLQKVEEQYHGKNIEFVSLSIDAKKDYEKWRKMVEEKKLGGIQLFADNDWNSKFVTDYAIEGIPRFILVDPNGNIISADAPRPSDPKLIEKLTELGI